MRRGCCVGCLLVCALVLGLLYLGGYWAGKLGLLEQYPHLDACAALPADAGVILRVDATSPEFYRLLQVGTGGLPPIAVKRAFPYELAFALHALPASREVGLDVALSARCLGGFLVWRMEPGQVFSGTPYRPVGLERLDRGVLLLKGARDGLQSSPEAPPSEGPAALMLQKDSDFELVIDNRAGGAEAVLAPYLQTESPTEAAPDSLARLLGDSTEQARRALAHLETLQLRGKFHSRENLTFSLEARSPSERDARCAELFLTLLKEQLEKASLPEGMKLHGSLIRNGQSLSGEFTLRGYDRWVGRCLQSYL